MRIEIPVLAVEQPIGQFFCGVMQADDVILVSKADMRRIEEGKDRFVGIQRQLRQDRVVEIGRFVNSDDGTFPTSVVLSLNGDYVEYDEARRVLVLDSTFVGNNDRLEGVASILDGQHRIEGLKSLQPGRRFDIPVSLFVDPDDADEAYIFATVNLAQTKVNTSLVYDLLDYAKARSPQKSCHDIVVALDGYELSPFYKSIKRLGTRTKGRFGEVLAQATVVTSLLSLMSEDAEGDRIELARGRQPTLNFNLARVPLRPLWLEERDDAIATLMIDYFRFVASTWPNEWGSRERGHILPRTNGFRAFMRFLRDVLNAAHRQGQPAGSVSKDFLEALFSRLGSALPDGRFTTEFYAPGTSGETALYNDLRRISSL